MDTLQQLNDTLVARKSEEASASYVASLYHGGVNKIAQKVGEEATEVILAAKDAASDAAHKPALIAEVADLVVSLAGAVEPPRPQRPGCFERIAEPCGRERPC
jgi:phosphoribosyl-ATP pyrophosphohydrolase